MGQRLIVTIENNDKVLAKAYYHWSGFTTSGLKTGVLAVEHFEKAIEKSAAYYAQNKTPEQDIQGEPDTLTACYMLFNTKAGLSRHPDANPYSEMDAFLKKYPNADYLEARDRDDGLVGITEEEMDDMSKWAEADVTINLHTKCVDVSGLFPEIYEEDDEYEDDEEKEDSWYKDEDGEMMIPDEYDIDRIPFDKLSAFAGMIEDAVISGQYNFGYRDMHLGVIE